MIPLTAHSNELKVERALLEEEARAVMKEQGVKVPYQFGTMIEMPRAALIADEIAEYAEFFSFGTNDLTQTTFGISRDDAETGFLQRVPAEGHPRREPVRDASTRTASGKLMEIGVALGRADAARPRDRHLRRARRRPASRSPSATASGSTTCRCSPFRVPVARLAAAHAALGDVRDLR